MRIVALAVISGLLAAFACGCTAATRSAASVPPPVMAIVPPDKPPPPKSWPPYRTFSAHSCWTRPDGSGTRVMRAAPSVRPKPRTQVLPPALIGRRLLGRFGDRRYIRRIHIGAPPPITLRHLHGWYAGARPPSDARWAYIEAPSAGTTFGNHATPEQAGVAMVAEWETQLVAGALRDDFCAAGGPPLVGASANETIEGVSSRIFALMQRFPNPSPQAFRRRVDLVGRRYGFDVVSLRLLQPRQLAPLLVVETSRARKAFVEDVPTIMSLLDPATAGVVVSAPTFEGFLLEARDAKGPFVRVDEMNRGIAGGGQWSWNPCVYPYAHSTPVFAKPCA